jgi:outer membrane protein assembly factor BamE (lipoprotein component of BamABCDE complex)
MTGFKLSSSRAFPRLAIALLASLLLAACSPQTISELEEGIATEADVGERLGAPEAVWDGPDGAQIYKHNPQPAGHVNCMIAIGADGKMSALRQVLTPQNFARIAPGMPMQEVRRLLGKPIKITPYDLKRQTHHDWRYQDGPNTSDSKIFTVVLDSDFKVASTGSVVDPALQPNCALLAAQSQPAGVQASHGRGRPTYNTGAPPISANTKKMMKTTMAM